MTAGPNPPLPLHHVSEEKRGAVHNKRHLGDLSGDSPVRDVNNHGRPGPIGGISTHSGGPPLFVISDATGEVEIRLGAFDGASTDLSSTL
jgi:hypothetical protein